MMRKNEKVCFISGKFNVLHPGHLRLFRHAKEIADQLIVGVFSDSFDSSGEFMVSEVDRLEGVRANRWVDQVIRVSSLSESIASLRPDIVLKGKEHETRYNEEEPLLTKYGGTLKFAGGDTRLSSSALLRSESNFESVNLRNAERFLNRHGLNSTDLVCSAENLASVRTLVLGDLIVDRYVDCQPIGLSAEDPTVVVSPLAEEKFVGGAGIVSAHAASFGSNAIFISVRGDDDAGVYADDELQRIGVETNIFVDSDRPTTQKTRYRANGKTLLRINEFRDHQLDKSISEQVIALTKEKIKEVDLIILSDFSYGLFSNELVNLIINESKRRGIFIAADSQSSSQIGDITRFRNVDLITPTEREARLAVRDNITGLIGVSEQLQAITNAHYSPITLAEEGVFLHRSEGEDGGWTDDQIPALNDNPVDVSGAGDAFLVSTAMSLAAGEDIWAAMYLGSVASACQVGRIGNKPLTRQELIDRLKL